MRLALATCADLPDWEVDDRPLHAALADRGVRVAQPVWDDPSVDWGQFNGVLIRTTWDYMHKFEAFEAWLMRVDRKTRLWNDWLTVAWNLHKSYLRQLEAAGVRTVPTLWLEDGAPVRESALRERGWMRAFVKPAVGASAVGTLPFQADAGGVAAANAVIATAGGTHLVQPYLSRVERDGERSAIVVEDSVTHFVRKVPVPGDYRVQDDYGASDAPYEPTSAERDLVADAMRAMGDLHPDALVYRIDWLLDDAGTPCLNELEAVEPSLFFRHGSHAAARLADALVTRLRS